MPQPTTYTRKANFAEYQATSPSEPLQGPKVDEEFNAIKTTLDEILANMALIQRDDGKIANLAIGADQLSARVSLGVDPATVWVASTAYVKNNTVIFTDASASRSELWLVDTNHVSGSDFDADAALYMTKLLDLTLSDFIASGISFAPGGSGLSVNLNQAVLDVNAKAVDAQSKTDQMELSGGVLRVAMDADADSYIVADTDDEIRFVTGGTEVAKVKSTGIESSSFRKTGGALMASPPIFDTAYGGETIGASDDGKSYLVDLASQETFSVAAISGLSTGWAITVRVIGDPSGYQSAKIGTTGTLLFRGEDSTDDFYLIGNGEALTLNKASDGKLHISTLSSPKRLTNFGTFTSSAVYNNGFTTWTSIPLDASSGFTPLISRANGGGTVSVSGVYSIICASRHYITTSGHIGNSEMKLQAGGEELASDLQFHEYQEGGQRALSASVYLNQGDTIDCQQIASTAFLYYLPNDGYVTVSLVSR